MVELNNITKQYKTKDLTFTALNNIDLSITDGESVAIMGKSGAGKTTLLNILGCLDDFEEGDYVFCGEKIKGMKDVELAKMRNDHIGFVMQDFALLNHKSVLFNVMLPMYFDKTPSGKMKDLAMKAIESVGIADQAKKKVNQLSGGQKQRVAIARAIVKQPEMILADEPTGALDSNTGEEIMSLLQEMNGRSMTIIIVTHDEMVASYCERKIILHDGEIVSDN